MADDEVQNEAEASGPDGEGRGRLTAILMLVGALLAGAAGGALLVGPLVVHRMSEPAEEPAAKGHGEAEVSTAFRVDNMVLNPAQTAGTRFLLTSVVAELDDPEAVASLEAKEAEVRDRLMALLGSRTVDQLTDVGQRDELKGEVARALEGIVAPAKVTAVFFPTFVIQ